MRISLSERDHKLGRHLVLLVSRAEESAGINRVIEDQVTERKNVIRERVMGTDKAGVPVIREIIYRFSVHYLERIFLTFPQAEWSKAAERYRKKMLYEEAMDGPVPDIVVPGFKGNVIFDYQKKAIKWCEDWLDDFHAVMLNDDMGLGKTVVCYSIIDRDKAFFTRQHWKRILVVTTNSGKRAWWKIAKHPVFVDGEQVEAPKFPKLDINLIEGTRGQRHVQLQDRHHITVINEEMIRIEIDRQKNERVSYPELFDTEWDLVIVDEYHHFKNPHAQSSVGFLRLKAKSMVIMSGTPFMNRPEELWTAFHRVDAESWPDYASFSSVLPIRGGGGRVIGYQRGIVSDIRDFLQERSLRRTRDDVKLDLPQVMPPTEITVQLTPEQRRLYDKLRDEFILALENGNEKKVLYVLAHITRLKQACFSPELYGGSKHSAKVDKLRDEIVPELVAAGHKAILFAEWKQACEIMRRELEQYNPAFVTGGMNTKARSLEEDRFNQDRDCKLYIGTISANQESISLGAASYVVFASQPWNPARKNQARDRSASGGVRGLALGKDVKVNVIDLHAENTIEEWVDDLLARKSRMFGAMIESDGGTQLPKTVIKDIREMLMAEKKGRKVA